MTVITLDTNTLDQTLNTVKPVLLLITDGTGLRGDFDTAFKKAAGEHSNITFARIDPKDAANFNAGDKPTLLAWYCGEELARRVRPWGTDVPLAVELLQKAFQENAPDAAIELTEDKPKMTKIVDTKPVNVTDDSFQQEVIDHDLPVLIDFWAAWCGPCRMVAPILDKLAEDYAGKIRIAKVDVDANPALSQHFQITSIPTLMMIKNRTLVFSQPGALPEGSIRQLIDQLIALEVPMPQQQPESEQN